MNWLFKPRYFEFQKQLLESCDKIVILYLVSYPLSVKIEPESEWKCFMRAQNYEKKQMKNLHIILT